MTEPCLPSPLDAALADWALTDAPRTQLTGDVSPRQYYRLRLPDGGTGVVMVTPAEKLPSLSDWLAIGDWLASHGLAVPRVLRRRVDLGVLLIEDGGDRLLTAVDDDATADGWYRDTLSRLADLERTAAGDTKTASPAHGRILTEERMRWELRRYRKVVAAPVTDLDDDELALWKRGEDQVVAALLAAPRVWMHRDLHARNLLIADDRAMWIDFQDAMMGPWQYDAVSLLFDPYAALDEARREALRAHYLACSTHTAGDGEADALWWLCAVQRLIHCVACYVFVCEHQANSAYVRYLPFALDRLREVMARCEAAEPLARVMAPRWAALAERWCAYAE